MYPLILVSVISRSFSLLLLLALSSLASLTSIRDMQGVELLAGAGVFVSNMSLVVQRVTRARGGDYTCEATNARATSSSPPLHLDVKCECRGELLVLWGAGMWRREHMCGMILIMIALNESIASIIVHNSNESIHLEGGMESEYNKPSIRQAGRRMSSGLTLTRG